MYVKQKGTYQLNCKKKSLLRRLQKQTMSLKMEHLTQQTRLKSVENKRQMLKIKQTRCTAILYRVFNIKSKLH